MGLRAQGETLFLSIEIGSAGQDGNADIAIGVKGVSVVVDNRLQNKVTVSRTCGGEGPVGVFHCTGLPTVDAAIGVSETAARGDVRFC